MSLSGKGTGFCAVSSGAAISRPPPKSTRTSASGISLPSTRSRTRRVSVTSLSRLRRLKANPSLVFSKEPNVYSCRSSSDGIFMVR